MQFQRVEDALHYFNLHYGHTMDANPNVPSI